MNEKRQHRLTLSPRTQGEPKVRSSELVRRLLRTWKKRRKEYARQERSLSKQGLHLMAHGALLNQKMCDMFINDLEWELPPNPEVSDGAGGKL